MVLSSNKILSVVNCEYDSIVGVILPVKNKILPIVHLKNTAAMFLLVVKMAAPLSVLLSEIHTHIFMKTVSTKPFTQHPTLFSTEQKQTKNVFLLYELFAYLAALMMAIIFRNSEKKPTFHN